MKRYIRQRNDSECGPVGIANALKWAGLKFSYREVQSIFRKVCDYVPGEGSFRFSPANALRRCGGLKVRRLIRPKIDLIDRHLNDGGAVLMAMGINDEWFSAHISLCIGKSEDEYILVNHIAFSTIVHYPRRAVIRGLRKRGDYPCVWLLRRS